MILFAPTAKPYRILFEHRPQYLYVRIHAETTNFAIAKQYWAEILTMLRHRQYNRVLVDKDIGTALQTPDLIMLVSELVNSGCHDVMFAILDRNYDAKRCAFEELAGTSRGLMVRFCADANEAESWLLMLPVSPLQALNSGEQKATDFAIVNQAANG